MEQFGWTEKELYEDNSYKRVRQLSEYNHLKNQHSKEEERKTQKQPSRWEGSSLIVG